jgi:hypothetical protein
MAYRSTRSVKRCCAILECVASSPLGVALDLLAAEQGQEDESGEAA